MRRYFWLNREILQNKHFQYFDQSKTRHDRAKIGLAGQHDRPPFKNYFEPWLCWRWGEALCDVVDTYFWMLSIARGKLKADSGERIGYWYFGTFHVVDSDAFF